MPNKFGGLWTDQKINIIIKYAKAYLEIMKDKPYKTIYFDGFAGSGDIEKTASQSLIEGVASQILAINKPCSFNMYYLVELKKRKAERLQSIIAEKFPNKQKNVFVVKSDCNDKLVGLANYLRNDNKYRALAFIDPHGMQVNWSSMEVFKGLGADMWLLIPTGIGVNRMLTRTGDISDEWMKKLSSFLGLSKEEIKKLFYKEEEKLTLFGSETKVTKMEKSVHRIMDIYEHRLKTVWKYVSKPFPLRNNRDSIMFHFILASQNYTAQKIANEIISRY